MVIRMRAALGVVALLAACTAPPSFVKEELPPIDAVAPNATPDEVVKVLGQPQKRERGYWRDCVVFDMDLEVWHYRGKGRVVFDLSTMTVYTSEAEAPAPRTE